MMIPEIDEFTSRFPDEIRTLLAMFRMSNMGGLAIAECDDLDLRTRLIDYFRRKLESDQIYIFNFELSTKDINLARTLSELTEGSRFKNLELTGKYKSIVFFVYGIEKFDPKQRGQFVHLLNLLRNRLAQLAQPIVIWGKASFVTELARNAPDFWSWKGHLFQFPSNAPLYISPNATDSAHAYNALSPLEQYLHRLIEDPDYAVWKDLYVPLKANRAGETLNPFAPRHTLTYPELRQIAPLFPTATSVPANQTIVTRGEKSYDCYIIVKGEVEVLVPDALDNDIVITKLGKGDFFGEIGLIKDVPRTATVRTTKPSKFITVTPRTLHQINQKAPAVFEILTNIADRRLERRLSSPTEVSPLRRFAVEGASLLKDTPIDVRELIANDRRTVILGEAGGGKTTVLRRLVLDTAEQSKHLLGHTNELVIMPIFIQLNALTPDKTIEKAILEIFKGYEIEEYQTEADIIKLLNGEQADETRIHSLLILLDGLNEMPFHDETSPDVSRFLRQYGQHRVVLSCRAEDYTTLHGFRTAMLQRLSGEDIELFLVNYLRAEQGRKVAAEIYSDPQLEDLAQTPLALYMFAQIAKRTDEALPKNRGVLFEVFIDNLLERTDNEWWKIFGSTTSQVPLVLRKQALANLGLTMQEKELWAFPRSRWVEMIVEALQNYRTQASPVERERLANITGEDVHEEIKHSGLIRYSTDRRTLEFAHHTYQEFFAALAVRDDRLDLEPHLTTIEGRRRWQGTTVLLYGITHDKALLYSKILGSENNYARIWLGAQCLANAGEEVTAALKQLERQLPLQQYFALLFSAGLASRLLGRYPEGLTYLHLATEEKPGSAEVQYELGSLYRQVLQYERAIVHLEEAISLRSDFVDAYNQLGITYHDQEKYVEALTIFKATTQLEPVNPHHYYNLGTTKKILRDYVGARTAFHTALSLKSDYSEAQTQLDILEKALSTGVVRILESIPILSKMTLEQSVLLANRIQVEEFRPGQIVFHMGEMGQSFYIIEVGEVEVLAPDLGGQRSGVINRLGPGDFFGEIALLRAVPRTATIRTTKPTRLLAVNREDFDQVVKKVPSIAHSVTETSSLRLLNDRQIGRRVELDRYYDPGYIAELTHQTEVTVLMGDIHGSTYLTNAIGPELMVAFLDEYLLRMSTIIVQAGGAMDKSLGDSVMGVFGHFPDRHEDEKVTSAKSALLASFKMRQAYVTLRDEWKKESPEFAQTGMGIGVSTGKITTGTVGAESTMVGPAVNMSSKLSKMAIGGRTESEIYIDARTLNLVGPAFQVEPLDYAYTRKKVGVDLDAYHVIQRKL
ncbi:cyclic nucleotide-binding domain-containing protein [Anaerolineales bacterium HSG24]|nr:cyclic nucleotide-binding domain-containing protein [Anaerolineales bacterium HSG24]